MSQQTYRTQLPCNEMCDHRRTPCPAKHWIEVHWNNSVSMTTIRRYITINDDMHDVEALILDSAQLQALEALLTGS